MGFFFDFHTKEKHTHPPHNQTGTWDINTYIYIYITDDKEQNNPAPTPKHTNTHDNNHIENVAFEVIWQSNTNKTHSALSEPTQIHYHQTKKKYMNLT